MPRETGSIHSFNNNKKKKKSSFNRSPARCRETCRPRISGEFSRLLPRDLLPGERNVQRTHTRHGTAVRGEETPPLTFSSDARVSLIFPPPPPRTLRPASADETDAGFAALPTRNAQTILPVLPVSRNFHIFIESPEPR